jgi:hypothetical protein
MSDGFNSKNASHNPKGLIFAESKEAAVEISRGRSLWRAHSGLPLLVIT